MAWVNYFEQERQAMSEESRQSISFGRLAQRHQVISLIQKQLIPPTECRVLFRSTSIGVVEDTEECSI